MEWQISAKRCLMMTTLTLVLFACGGSGGSPDNSPPATTTPSQPETYEYQIPAAKNDGWQINSAHDLGVDVSLLESLMDRIYQNDYGFRRMDGVLIVKDNQLIFDTLIRTQLDVADGWAANTNLEVHSVHSVTKSVMSLSMGIAIEQGLVGSVNDPALDYFPDYAPFGGQEALKSAMTIEHWLTMQHGLDWDEWNVNYQDSSNQNLQMINARDPLQFLFNQTMITEPGTEYAYSTGISYALGEIIARTSDMTLLQFMQNNLFQPLGIGQIDHWDFHGDVHGGSGLYFTLRDMAKLGQLVLDNGVWLGQQVVPASWITESTALKVESGSIRYAYQWWINDFAANGENFQAVYANGWGGQFVFVFPALNAVVIMTGHRYEDGQSEETSVRTMLEEYILPALLSAG